MQNIHSGLAKWLMGGSERSFSVQVYHYGPRFWLRLRGPAADGKFLTTFAIIDKAESGISGGGDKGNGVHEAVKEWEKAAGIVKVVKKPKA